MLRSSKTDPANNQGFGLGAVEENRELQDCFKLWGAKPESVVELSSEYLVLGNGFSGFLICLECSLWQNYWYDMFGPTLGHGQLVHERGQVSAFNCNTVHIIKRKMETRLSPVREHSSWNGWITEVQRIHRCCWDVSGTGYILVLIPYEKLSSEAINC